MTLPSMAEILGKAVKGGGKYVAWENVEVGSTIGGIIVGEGRSEQQTDANTKQPRFFDDGSPMIQIVVPVQCPPNAAVEGDSGIQQFTFRGGFTYESSFKGLVNELRRNGIEGPVVGDHLAVTRLANRKGKGLVAKTHQFAVRYTKAEDFTPEMKAFAETVEVGAPAPATPAPAADPWS